MYVVSELVAVITLHLIPSATVVSAAPALASTSSLAFSFALSPFLASASSAVTHLQSNVAAVRVGAIMDFAMLVPQHDMGNQLIRCDLGCVGDRADEGIIVRGEGGDDPVYEDTVLEW